MTTRANHFQTVPVLINTLVEASMASHKSSLEGQSKTWWIFAPLNLMAARFVWICT
jgi:hypothetical protein